MTINLRTNKGSALSFGELDGNFTTLGLTHGMTNSNVAIGVNAVTATTGTITTAGVTTLNVTDIDVSNQIVINETPGNYTSQMFVSKATTFDSHLVIRTSDAVAGNTALTYQREHTGNAASGIGAGVFAQFKSADITSVENLGGWDFKINDYTDVNNYNTKWSPYVYNTASGTQTAFNPIHIEHDNIEAKVPVQLASYDTTQANALGNLKNGMLIYNTNTNKVQARVEGAWVNLH
tara:strand:+ start:1163 stop:1867 length:705 start_codon:yes stop_codon:yes gene_type:complete